MMRYSQRLCLIIAMLGLIVSNWAGTVYVDCDATGSADGSSWADAYTTIQGGISGSSGGDTVIVAEGTYTEQIDFGGKAITVTSTEPNDWDVVEATMIDGDANGSVVTFDDSETSSSVLEGFTITNGYNDEDGGGGIYCDGSSPTIRWCKISENYSEYGGGGIYLTDGSDCAISYCMISGNVAEEDGGGIYADGSDAVITNSLFYANDGDYGGAMYCDGSSDVTLTNCTASQNDDNYGGDGLCVWSATASLENCIFWANGSDAGLFLLGSTLNVDYSDIEGGQSGIYNGSSTINWGSGNIDSYPYFSDFSNDDYHLTRNSPCIDKGDPNGVYTSQTDIDSESRVLDDEADMGADEWYEAPPENLILNPGFEEEQSSQPINWSTWDVYSCSLDSTVVHSGNNSWKFEGNGEDYSCVYSDYIAVNPSTTYTLSGWVKTSGQDEDARVQWVEDDDQNSSSYIDDQTLQLEGYYLPASWTPVTGDLTTSASTNWVRVRMWGPYATEGTVWWDDFSLKETKPWYLFAYGSINDSDTKSVNFGEGTNKSWTNYSTAMGSIATDNDDSNIHYRPINSDQTLEIAFPEFNTDANGFPETPMLLEFMYQDTFSGDSTIYSYLKYNNFDPNYLDSQSEFITKTVSTISGINDNHWKYIHVAFQKSDYQLLRAFNTDDSQDESKEFLIKIKIPSGVTLPVDYVSLRAISQDQYEEYATRQRQANGFFEVELPDDEPASPPTYSNLTVFTRDIMHPVYRHTKPASSEIDQDIIAISALGETEPLSFAIYSENGVTDVSVEVSDLVCADPCCVIDNDDIGIYHVVYDETRLLYRAVYSYALVPDRLEEFTSLDIDSDTSERIWLKVNVPDNITSGMYEGSITIKVNGIQQDTIDIDFKVIDEELLHSEQTNYVYDDPYGKIYSSNLDTVLNAYAETGFDPMIWEYSSCHIDVSADANGDPNFDTTNFEEALDRMIAEGFAQTQVNLSVLNVFKDLYNAVMDPDFSDTDPNLYTHLSDANYVGAVNALMSEYNNIASSRNLEFVYHVWDEPANRVMPRILCDRLYTLIKNNGGKTSVTYYANCDDSISSTGSYVVPEYDPLDPNIYLGGTLPALTNLVDYKVWGIWFAESAYENHQDPNYYGDFGYYATGRTHLYDPTYNRFLHGLYAFATDATVIGAYAFGDYVYDPYNDFDSKRHPDYLYAYPTWTGELHSAVGGLEGIREGIKDAKYIATLKSLIENDPCNLVAIDAQDYLDEVKARISVDFESNYENKASQLGYQPTILEAISEYDDPNDYGAFTRIREQIIEYILELKLGVYNVDQDQWFDSIQDAIDDAATNDEIVVYPGTYTEQIDFGGKAITITSTDPCDPFIVAATVIDGDANGTVVTFDDAETSSSILEGFTITNGYTADEGGGILCDGASPTIRWCVITSNEAEIAGAGIALLDGSEAEISLCKIVDNVASDGDGGGIYADGSDAALINCLLYNNESDCDGGAINNYGSDLVLANCTVSGNDAGGFGDSLYQISATTDLDNCIFWGNDSSNGIYQVTSTLNVDYCDIQGDQGAIGNYASSTINWGSGNINSNPDFTDADCHLDSDSPCIDAGDNSVIDWSDDLDGDSRKIDDPNTTDTGSGTSPIVDMGSDEYDPGS